MNMIFFFPTTLQNTSTFVQFKYTTPLLQCDCSYVSQRLQGLQGTSSHAGHSHKAFLQCGYTEESIIPVIARNFSHISHRHETFFSVSALCRQKPPSSLNIFPHRGKAFLQ